MVDQVVRKGWGTPRVAGLGGRGRTPREVAIDGDNILADRIDGGSGAGRYGSDACIRDLTTSIGNLTQHSVSPNYFQHTRGSLIRPLNFDLRASPPNDPRRPTRNEQPPPPNVPRTTLNLLHQIRLGCVPPIRARPAAAHELIREEVRTIRRVPKGRRG